MATTPKTTRRPRNRMPTYVRRALQQHCLMAAYRARPAYQRNDYLGWIAQAKRTPTRQKRLAQMLTELAGGRKYMNMAWSRGPRRISLSGRPEPSRISRGA